MLSTAEDSVLHGQLSRPIVQCSYWMGWIVFIVFFYMYHEWNKERRAVTETKPSKIMVYSCE